MNFDGKLMAAAGTLVLAACATTPITGGPAVSVVAVGETKPVGTVNEDAADDPAIWRNAADPTKSLIVGTDKKGGLYVYDLTGAQQSFLPAPGLNNVDLVELPDGRVMVVASDRSELATAHIFLAELNTATATLTFIQRIAVGPGEGYGICTSAPQADGSFNVYSAPKNGIIYRTGLQWLADSWDSGSEPLNRVSSQPEGCIFDNRSGTLFIGEENAGIWAMEGQIRDSEKSLVARIDNNQLVADVEGLAIAPEGADGGYLLASSQGDNAYAVYRLPNMDFVGRFRIAQGQFGATEETDGIELILGDFGPQYSGGLFIAQDGINGSDAQNFKLVPWDAIKAALQLP